jgi:hypothetical protein
MADKKNIAQTSQPVVKIGFGDPKAITEGDTQINQQATTQFKKEKDISKIGDKARQSFGLKEGQTTATGLEKAIFVAGDGILKAQFAIDGLFYGKFGYEGTNVFKKTLDKGVVNVLNDLSEIDLCNILNLLIEKTAGSKTFDPENKPTSGTLAITKWNLQNKALTIQKKIDGFHSSYLDTQNQESKAKGVYGIINDIKEAFSEITDPGSENALRDPLLIQSFPQLDSVNTFLEKAIKDFNKYTDYRQIPIEDLQRQINNVDKVREYAILIQGLNTPAQAISFVDSVFPNANIQDQIDKLQKLIDPARLMPLLKNIVESLKKIQSVCNVFASFITFGQSIIKIATLIIKVFKIIGKFLKALGIPNQFTILGLNITLSDTNENIKGSLTKLLDRLSQINTLLSLCVGLLSQVIIVLYDIIAKINRMLVGLESCNNADPQIIKDLQNSRDDLQKTAEYFQKFIDNYNTKKNTDTASFGDYTIQIVTEEVVDDAIRLRRRYGVAIATNGTLVAQSTPTFASDNQIIINEVKVQLAAKGFVKSYIQGFSPSELSIMSESLSFVLDNDITLDDIENIDYNSGLDAGENENENDGLGLNAFVNKLQGGKKLRKRMRKIMIQNNLKLTADLKAQDPDGKFSKNLVKQKEDETNKLKIEQLESEKKELVAAMIANPSPVFKAATIIKIKEKQQEIDKLKKQGQ